ncbi:mannose-6-phosphate isomerase, class I [Leucobacter coleopterorum]|uniref:mannose-6-phosphate isomerase n=1 Tax=Leucobacter coleopterorum TaxID=2714933 RepID=A0ABX6JY66_9MICO|nr:mannose-6-phosphate isomerase, class I [Leucobacter coleopterorum]QIM19272.1 mannose-6-phosphate isomerase, class I [Leucobacter coleopterorum]
MLIFIENIPRAYAWGSMDALAEMLGTPITGEPQAELWLGAHPGNPALVAKASPAPQTLIDLIERDPERYGVDGGQLPFLLKVLAIGAPLSLQVHPNLEQAAAGFAAEEAAGVPNDARNRNYGDANHKPELLVALSEVTALSGFRSLTEARHDLLAFAALTRGAASEVLAKIAERLAHGEPESLRREFLTWVFSGDPLVTEALAALNTAMADAGIANTGPVEANELLRENELDPERVGALRALAATYPGDPGILVSLLLHLVRLAPGEAIYLEAQQLHAYLGGVGVEVMAASDNVLRAGLTQKHVDIAELTRVVDTGELDEPRFPGERLSPGLVAWRPPVPDFQLLRARLCDSEDVMDQGGEAAPSVNLSAQHPVVLVVTSGRVRVERPEADLEEVAAVRRGQSLYVSAGAPIRLTGSGEVFAATVGR